MVVRLQNQRRGIPHVSQLCIAIKIGYIAVARLQAAGNSWRNAIHEYCSRLVLDGNYVIDELEDIQGGISLC